MSKFHITLYVKIVENTLAGLESQKHRSVIVKVLVVININFELHKGWTINTKALLWKLNAMVNWSSAYKLICNVYLLI